MSDNWLALAVAILSPKEIGVKTALIRTGVKIGYHKNPIEIDKRQFNKIKKLRDKKVPWKDIPKEIGCKCSGQALRDKFVRISKKKLSGTPTKVIRYSKIKKSS